MRGAFFTFEKTYDALGGSTQLKLLAKNLRERGYEVVETEEPAGTTFGKEIRPMIVQTEDYFNDPDYHLCDEAELLMFIAARAQHVHEKIIPALESGKVVLCDRYDLSTIAHQGGGKGWDTNTLKYLHKTFAKNLNADMVFVFDGFPFRDLRYGDTIERRGDRYYERVRARMREVLLNDERCIEIEANREKEIIEQEILNYALSYLNGKVIHT